MELAVAELENVQTIYAVQQQKALMDKLIASTHKTIRNVEEQFQHQARESKDIMDSLSYVMENESFVRSMDPTFRRVFQDIMRESKQRFDDLHAKGVAVDRSFSQIIDRLSAQLH
jgi:hypothetical protein